MAAAAERTVSFFRLVKETSAGSERLGDHPWQTFLAKVYKQTSIEARTVEMPSRRLIGEILDVDGDYALKLMEPRDENSWLEILRQEAGAEAVDAATIGQLVETSIVVFLPGHPNLVGMIKGSASSPSHVAVGDWLTNIRVEEKTLVDPTKEWIRAEPALSRAQKRKLDASSGVSMASVRISTSKAQQLQDVGSRVLGDTLQSLSRTYGDIFVTVTMKVPRGKSHDRAREELKRETDRLRQISDVAERVSATLVTYDAESKAHQEDVEFVSQRITTKRGVPLTGDDGQPIRNSSAVRAILAAAHELRRDLASAV